MKFHSFLALAVLALSTPLCPSAEPPAAITNIVVVGGAPQLAIRSDLGLTNEVQGTTNLTQTNWYVLTNLLVTQSPYFVTDFTVTNFSLTTQRYYRVVAILPNPDNMVFVPGGEFTMGNAMATNEGGSDELPLHVVSVSAFWMDQHEVTKSKWEEVQAWAVTNGYSFSGAASGKSGNHPVHSVPWHDAVKWCNARSEMEGRTPAYYTDASHTTVYRTGQVDLENDWVKWDAGYRLPTEAEWEKAGRGGAGGRRFPWIDTDNITHSNANYFSSVTFPYTYELSSPKGYHPVYNDGVIPYTSPVGSFAPNGFGLYDIAGNVWEWCWDRYSASYYSSSPINDPRGPLTGSLRSYRGGSWGQLAEFCRVANRSGFDPAVPDINIGFRTVLPVPSFE